MLKSPGVDAPSKGTGKPGQKKKPGFVSQKLMAVVKN
jgi:hypothetical protein